MNSLITTFQEMTVIASNEKKWVNSALWHVWLQILLPYVFVMHVLQQTNFTVPSFSVNRGLKWARQLLNRHLDSSFFIICWTTKRKVYLHTYDLHRCTAVTQSGGSGYNYTCMHSLDKSVIITNFYCILNWKKSNT